MLCKTQFSMFLLLFCTFCDQRHSLLFVLDHFFKDVSIMNSTGR